MSDSHKRFNRQFFDDDLEYSHKRKKAGGKHSHVKRTVDEEVDLEDVEEYTEDIEYFMKKWK